ncbi:MAG: type 1 glutamine amidotransferase [Nitrosopumilaceae archaeon]
MTDVLILQNSKIEGPGVLGNLLETDGFTLKTIYTKQEKIPSDHFSLLVVLGSTESANEPSSYLVEEQKLIKKTVEKNIPVLGICLGSQLIAKTFGGKVFPGSKKEIGFYDDVELDDRAEFFSGIKTPMTVFHWHGDTFTLPENAIRLAHSKNYENQAFQIQSAIGLQFHLEVDETIVNLWLDKSQEYIKKLSYIDSDNIRQNIDEKIPIVQNNMKIFYKNFKSKFKL